MNGDLGPTLIKLALPLFAIVVVVASSKARGLSLGRDLGLGPPRVKSLLGWLAAWIVWVALEELVIRRLGLEQPGVARHRSGSTWVPAILHMVGNLFSIAQSLTTGA